jgi:cytochrome P450
MPWLDRLLQKNPVLSRLGLTGTSMVSIAMERIQERLSSSSISSKPSHQQEDLLSKFLSARVNNPETVPEWFILSWIMTNLIAGSDTTAISLRAMFYYLLKNPASLSRLRAEIGTARSNPVSWAEAREMKYLDACIKEALRLHPAVGLPLERVVPPGGMEISGRHFEGGTIVGISAWIVQRDKGVYGEDADSWRPERWLEDEERRKRMDRASLAFGAGGRTCIGKNISLLEMYKVIPQILRCFEVSVPER